MKVVVFNLGCKVNQYECDVICEELKSRGFEVSEELGQADAYIINTCAVTAEAERKSRQAVARCRAYNGNASILVCGCASQKSPSSFEKDGVIYIAGAADKNAVIGHLFDEKINTNVAELPLKYENSQISVPGRTRAYVKIQDGCNNFCSYCIIPYLRGRSRSRSQMETAAEVERLAPLTHEIVLTGIDLMSYGKDTGGSLAELMLRLKDADVRLRLGSVYAENITEELLDALFGLKKFCPHFHLSLQSGDNAVLKAMNRHYTAEIYEEKINLIRKYDKLAGITTDVIVGFPTETDKAFENTCSFVQKAEFSDLHIFPFSAREGTPAAKFPQLSSDIVKERKSVLSNIKKVLKNNFLKKNIGKEQEVLVEEKIGDRNVGYSRNYIRVYTQHCGETVAVTPTALYKDGLTEV